MLFEAFVIVSVLLVVMGVFSVVSFNTRRPTDPPIHPSYIPFIGHLFSFGINPREFLVGLRKKIGKVYTLKMLGNRMTVIADPSLHKDFFLPRNEILSPREVYNFMKPIFGDGVAYGASYARMREQLNILAEELNIEKFKSFVPAIQYEVRKFVQERWRGDSGQINLLHEMSALIINTSVRCLFGGDFRKFIDGEKFAHWLAELESSLNPASVFLPWLPSPNAPRRDRARKEILEALTKIIEERKKTSNADSSSDLLKGLMSAQYRDGTLMTLHEVCGMIIAAMFAGQHTSSITTTWTLMHLMQPKNKKHLEHLRREIEEFPANLSYEVVMEEMPFAEACARESIRRDPPLILLMRKVMEPIKVGDWIVPKGDIIACGPVLSHHVEEYFPNARTWNPERTYDPSWFIGFGAGVHKCMGEKFGLLQVKTVVSTILQEFSFEPIHPETPEPDYHTMVAGPPPSQCNVKFVRLQK